MSRSCYHPQGTRPLRSTSGPFRQSTPTLGKICAFEGERSSDGGEPSMGGWSGFRRVRLRRRWVSRATPAGDRPSRTCTSTGVVVAMEPAQPGCAPSTGHPAAFRPHARCRPRALRLAATIVRSRFTPTPPAARRPLSPRYRIHDLVSAGSTDKVHQSGLGRPQNNRPGLQHPKPSSEPPSHHTPATLCPARRPNTRSDARPNRPLRLPSGATTAPVRTSRPCSGLWELHVKHAALPAENGAVSSRA